MASFFKSYTGNFTGTFSVPQFQNPTNTPLYVCPSDQVAFAMVTNSSVGAEEGANVRIYNGSFPNGYGNFISLRPGDVLRGAGSSLSTISYMVMTFNIGTV